MMLPAVADIMVLPEALPNVYRKEPPKFRSRYSL
jgi:hypothetical protein